MEQAMGLPVCAGLLRDRMGRATMERTAVMMAKEPSTSNGERSTCKHISQVSFERWKLNVECSTLAAAFHGALPVVLLAVALFVSISSKAQTNEQRNLVVVV